MPDLRLLRLMQMLAHEVDALAFGRRVEAEADGLDLASLRFEGGVTDPVKVSHVDVGAFTATELDEMVRAARSHERANVEELIAPDGKKTLLEQAEEERASDS